MQTFKSWLKNEITGIYPPLYGGLAAYPDAYFVNSSYKVYIDASLKAKTNPPDKKIIKENLKGRINFSEFLTENNEKVDFVSFNKTGEIKVLVNGTKHIFIVNGFDVDKFKQLSKKNSLEAFNKLKYWTAKGLAQEI